MKTLVTDDFAERPEPEGVRVTFTFGDSTNTFANVSHIQFDPIPEGPRPPLRTQAWVGKPIEEITDGTER